MLGLYPREKRKEQDLTTPQIPRARPPMSVDHLA